MKLCMMYIIDLVLQSLEYVRISRSELDHKEQAISSLRSAATTITDIRH